MSIERSGLRSKRRFQPGISGRFPLEWVAGFVLEWLAVGIRIE